MIYQIQPAVQCENCIKCGAHPVIEQTKKTWKVKCPNEACNNEVSSNLIDLDQWNRKNRSNIDLYQPSAVIKHSA